MNGKNQNNTRKYSVPMVWLVNQSYSKVYLKVCNSKQEVMKLFESEIDNDTPTGNEPKRIMDVFEGDDDDVGNAYVNYN